mgnify:CR=1 FL=1
MTALVQKLNSRHYNMLHAYVTEGLSNKEMSNRFDLNDLSLEDFSGIDGMVFLIGMSIEYTGKGGAQRFLNHVEFACLLMRLHLPYYEKTSHLFDLESLSDKRKAYSPSRMKHLLQCAA